MEQAILNNKFDVDLNRTHTRCNALAACLVFLISFTVYLMTIAPTLAFWDCGEYIAAGHALGIPHPPGNPLFVLIMRVSSIFLFFFEDPGYRMNFVTALSSALTAAVIYLVIVEASKLFIGTPDTLQKRMAMYIGGIVGGLFAAFGYTFWFSAVETSVYNLSMLVIAICTWLMLRWAQSRNPHRDRLLILVSFLGFLGIGLHMYSMIIFPPAFLFMIMWDEKKRKDWRLWLTGLLMASIIYSLASFIKFSLVVVAFNLLMSMTSKNHRPEWRFCFFLSIFTLIGYSIHLFIPIRAALEPMLNSNHATTWEAFVGFLERQQYGSESMVTRMFWRRGLWENQFGIEEHMGYGGFHITQFFHFDPQDRIVSLFANGFIPGISKLLLYLIPTTLMIYGWVYLWKKNRAASAFLVSLTLLTTIGLVLYMNFADGLRPERWDYEQWIRAGQPGPMPTVHREVRVRDYFFTAGFMYFGMWIGLAASCLLYRINQSKNRLSRTIVAPVCAVLLAVSPVIPMMTNYSLNSRAGDWAAFDYAYNLLNSCEPNGIIFTNGDNDTFPLWALQQAYGIRPDVRVIVFSYANMGWYIKQLKKLEPRVPISYTYDEIDRLEPRLNPFENPRRHTLPNANLTLTLPGQQQRRVLRVQDLILLNIVDANAWNKPIYFAMTGSDDNFMGLGPFLRSEGLVYRLLPEPVTIENHYNLDRTIQLIDEVFKMQGIGEAIHNNTSRRQMIHYLQVAFDLRRPLAQFKREVEQLNMAAEAAEKVQADMYADSMNIIEDTDKTPDTDAAQNARRRFTEAEEQYNRYIAATSRFLSRCVDIMPWEWRARAVYFEFFIDHDMIDEALSVIERALEEDPANRAQYEPMLEQVKRLSESS